MTPYNGYHYNELGQRDTAAHSGQAVKDALIHKINSSAWFENAVNEGDGIEVPPEYREYTYDNIGNRWDAVDWNAASGDYRTTAYTANSLNQYEDQVAAGGATETYDYDEDGNLVLASDGSYDTIYTYNAENLLTAVRNRV